VKKNKLGIEELAEVVGMPKIDSNAKWAVTICKLQQGKYKWKLVKLKENDIIQHECIEEKVEFSLQSKNFKIEDEQHWSFLIEDNVNKVIEI
jgi:hypothetical protein